MARLSPLPGLFFGQISKSFLAKQDADEMFVTRDPRRPSVLPDRPLFRFVYEIAQLEPFWENYSYGLRFLYERVYRRDPSQTRFLALSPRLLAELKHRNFYDSQMVYPSYGIGYRPRPKKNQLVYVTFLAPQKRIGDFMEIARNLPEYKFYLVGRDTERMNRIYGGYAQHVLANKPNNVQYVEARIRQSPELLEESRVYLHTSIEEGMGIAVMEALSAGCFPVTPAKGGAGDVLAAAGVGFRYNTIEESIEFLRSEMASENQALTAEAIAERGRIFSQEAFEDRMRDVIGRRSDPR